MATIKRKQLKRTYKIPRSLKKSIKKNLVKIVKKRERRVREEEVSVSLTFLRSYSVHHCYVHRASSSDSVILQPQTDIGSFSAYEGLLPLRRHDI
jgi:hypothetical protein